MSWKIVLEDEDGAILSFINEELDTKVSDDLTQFVLLRYLDAYGNTIFNRLQMDDLIQDLHRLKELDNDPILGAIKLLAERCKNETHNYVIFYGD